MTHSNVSATSGIAATRIDSRADVSAGCRCGGVCWISMSCQGTKSCLCNGYQFRTSPKIPEKSFRTMFTHSARIFHYTIHSGNSITTFSVSSVHIIAAATKVKVVPRPISSDTSAPEISASHTHLFTMNHIAQTWYARNLVPGRPGIQFLWPGAQSSVDLWIGWAFSSLTCSSRHSCSNSLLIVLRTVLNTGLVLSGLWTSSPSTCSLISLAPWLVYILSSMISFSWYEVSYADGIIPQHFWNSSQC